jgi:membrane protease YdiL (CAAX protease family)
MRDEEVLKGPVETEKLAPPDDPVAAALRGFGPIGIVAILVILASNFVIAPINAILVLVWARLSRTPWREIGYVRPKSWIGSVVVGIVFGCAFKFLMKAMVMPILGAPPTNAAYHFLVGNKAALPGMLFLLMLDAGFGEETVYRGWMFERLGKLFGRSVWATTLIVLITSILFSLAHYSVQGLPGSEQALFTGMVFGTIYAVTGRLFLVMVTHVAFDVTALAMIYWNFETAVAHSIFK